MGALWQDVKYGARVLGRNPGFAAVAVLTLALGIGLNTAIFSLVNVALLRTLPVSHPEELVSVRWESPHVVADHLPYTMFAGLRENNVALAGMFGFRDLGLATSIDGKPGLAEGQLVSGNFFSLLGVRPAAGRAFTAEEDRVPGRDAVAVISYGYWQRQFGGNAATLGKRIVLNGTPFTIIGVAPPEFFGTNVGDSLDIWIPMAMQAAVMDGRSLLDDSKSWWLPIMARRKPGVSEAQATASLNVTYQRIARQEAGGQLSPEEERELASQKIALLPASKGFSQFRDRFSQPLLILMGLAGVVLLVACTNVASLALVRASARQREMAVRAALGAGRWRLLRQLLTENFLLAGLSGLCGLLFALWGGDFLLRLLASSGMRVTLDLRPDASVLTFAAGLTVVAGMLFGTATAPGAARAELNAALQAGARALTSGGRGRSRWGLQNLLVAGEVAMSLLLLVGASMLVRSLQKLGDVEPGFDPANVLLVAVDPTFTGNRGTPLMILYKELAEAAGEVPGVRAASLSALAPMTSSRWTTGVYVQGHVPGPNETTTALMNLIGPNFFSTLRIPLREGRDFTWNDDANASSVAIINETMARFYFGSDSALGKRISFGGPQSDEIEIVGVARDIKYGSLREVTPRMIYLPYLQTPPASLPFGMVLQIRTAGDPESFVGAIRGALRRVRSDLPILGFATLADRLDRSLGRERLVAQLSSFFGALAMLLAAIGIYGVMTYRVTRRTGEFGIRVALGAQPSDILRMVLREALRLVAVGALGGLALAFAFARLLSSEVYGISLYDPWAVGVATILLAGVSVLASFLPARRATRIEPVIALRYE